LPSRKALLVAAVGFAVAGADGRFSQRETTRLRAWLREVPAFSALDEKRVIAAVATLVCDSARTLFEARRHLDGRERLLAWALANDMAHAEGFTTADERRYLTSVASIFEIPFEAMEPFLADASSRAVLTETNNPPPMLED
jgi:tellurite resistance protein